MDLRQWNAVNQNERLTARDANECDANGPYPLTDPSPIQTKNTLLPASRSGGDAVGRIGGVGGQRADDAEIGA